jgi:hypothetical protein
VRSTVLAVAVLMTALGMPAAPVGASAAPGLAALPTFPTQAAAQAHCPQDTVVWVDTDSGVYFFQGDKSFGQAQPGAYACEKDADGAGYHQAQRSDKGAALAPTPAPTPTVGTAIFRTIVPATSEDRSYDCGSGIRMVASARAYGANGQVKVTYTWSGLAKAIAPSSFLASHDGAGDTMIDGYFDSAGKLSPLQEPALAVPVAPSPGFQVTLPQANGGSYVRSWLGSSTVDVPYGHFPVELYSDKFPASTEVDAFADGVGIVQYVLYSKDQKAFLTCGLASVTPR